MRAVTARASSNETLESSRAAAMPMAVRQSIWSFISAISGETTSVSAVEQQRRQLVAEALAAAGRKHGERGAAGQQGVDHLLLAGPEVGEAESLGEHPSGRVSPPRAA